MSDWGWEYGEDIPPAMTGVAPPYRTRTSYPSIAVNARGDMLLNFVADGPNIYAGAYYAVHRVNDPPHTIGPSVALAVGQGVYPANLTGGRWGDYSGAAVDPSDDNTFWIENLYAESSSGNIVIGTRIGELSNNLVVAGDDYGLPPTDAIAIARDAVNTSLLDINVNGTREFQGEFAAINQITVNSLTGNDVLTVDTTYGSPVPSGGFTYDGGSGFNTLKIIGSGSVNNVASMDALSFTINGSTMKYVNVESIEFDGGAGNDTLTISANVPLGPSFHGGTGADTLNVNAGTFAPPGDAGAFCSALTINDNSKVQFNATQHLAGLTIGAGDVAFMVPGVTANQNTLNVASLSIASTGKLDLANNSLAVSYAAGASPASTIRSYLVSGYAAGAWNGYGIQTSLGNSSTLALGYRDEADGIVGGPSSNVVLVMFTVYGDANLDGHVNSSDQTLLNTYLGMSSGALWDEGDFNYDGQVSAADSSLLTANLDPVYSGGAGAITVAGTSGNDAITIKLDASNPSLLDTIVNGVQTQTTFSSVTQIIVNGLGGIDTLTVDATNGSPIPTNGIDFNRSTGTGKLIIKGANATNTASVTSSAFTLNGGTIAYGTAQSVEFDGGSGNDTLTIPSLLPFSPIFNPGTGSGSDTLNVNAGTYNFAADAAIDTSSLTVNDNANVIFDLGRQIAGLNIGAGNIATLLVNAAPDTQKLTLGSLSIASTGILNLGNDEMMLNYGTNADPVSAIRSYLVSGYNGGAWNGYGIQTSIGDNARFALGYADGADGVVAGLSSTSILVMFTRYGDVDLSGQVLQPDLTLLSAHYNGSGASWDQGDMNYDGTVTFSDLLILAQNYGGTP